MTEKEIVDSKLKLEETLKEMVESLDDSIFDKQSCPMSSEEYGIIEANRLTEELQSLAKEGNLYIPGNDGIPVRCSDAEVSYDAKKSSKETACFSVLATLDCPPIQMTKMELHPLEKGEE